MVDSVSIATGRPKSAHGRGPKIIANKLYDLHVINEMKNKVQYRRA